MNSVTEVIAGMPKALSLISINNRKLTEAENGLKLPGIGVNGINQKEVFSGYNISVLSRGISSRGHHSTWWL